MLDFKGFYADLCGKMRIAPIVHPARWQGVDVSQNKAAQTRELQNVPVEVDLGGVEDLQHWRDDCRPNLPWADDHFEERVGGQPLNPGVQWAKWPWASRADTFRKDIPEELGPRMPQHDWAYLAGLIDGDGCIHWKEKSMPSFQGRVYVGQKDRRVLDWIHQTFKVGNVVKSSSRTQTLNGKKYENNMTEWQVSPVKEVRWILSGCLPYFRVKKERAEQVLEAINISLTAEKKKRAPIKKVWDRDWPARFNHSYPDRLWSKKLEGGTNVMGPQRVYGDLSDLVDLLVKDPLTRQAWIPLFHPEDTGWGDGGRKPCSLGYQFMIRPDSDGVNRMSVYYPMRSCDLLRHFRDDCYLTVRLLLWVLGKCRERAKEEHREWWSKVIPGTFLMHATSLHIFLNDGDML